MYYAKISHFYYTSVAKMLIDDRFDDDYVTIREQLPLTLTFHMQVTRIGY